MVSLRGSLRRPTVEARYRLLLVAAFVVAAGLRIPATLQELPPFQFCDEAIFSGETYRMLTQHTWVTNEFRSGGMNIYPMMFAGQILRVAGSLTPTSLVVVGRWLYAVLLASAAVFPVAGAARRLTGSRRAGTIAAALYLLSPSLLAVSRYWYPDHYAVVFSASIVYFIVRLLRERPTGRERLLLMVALGAVAGGALAVKYTFTVAAMPIGLTLLAGLFIEARSAGARILRVLADTFTVAVVAAAVAVGLDFSAIINPVGFRDGFVFNIQNYSRPGGGPAGIGFYAFLLFVAAFGVLGLVGLVSGVARLARTQPLVLLVLLSFPIVNVVYLGMQGLVYNRNIIASVPFIMPVLAAGLGGIVLRQIRWRIPATVAVLTAAGLQAAQVGYDFVADLAPDSEPIATAWIAKHVPQGATVGTNGTCSVSTAQVAGRTTEDDPDMSARLSYYVINSYWDSALDGAFRGRAAAWAILNQKYLHYYFPSDRALPSEVLELPWITTTPQDVAPTGYRVIKVFNSNGPTIVVLRRG